MLKNREKPDGRCAVMLAVLSLVAVWAASGFAGVCTEISPTSENVINYHVDYLPRIDFLPPDGVDGDCPRPLPANLPQTVSLEIYAYNLNRDLLGAEFRIVADAPIQDFTPGPGLMMVAGDIHNLSATTWVDDIRLSSAGEPGPVMLGTVSVLAEAGVEGFCLDLVGFGGGETAVMSVELLGDIPALSPRHGASVGAGDYYHCQPPLCEEPHLPILDFEALQSGGLVIELGWIAGEGNMTMIRYRYDGFAPTTIHDGFQLVLMPTEPGQSYSFVHPYPRHQHYWYTIFNLTKFGCEVVRASQVESGSTLTASVDESVPAEDSSWGAVKSLYR